MITDEDWDKIVNIEKIKIGKKIYNILRWSINDLLLMYWQKKVNIE